jgi:MraZ protein
MIIGQYKSKLTDKERIAVPKKFREEIGADLILARWYESCLVLVSKENWEYLLSRLTGNTKVITQSVRDIDRFIYASAFETKLDKQGRFIIPETLKIFANLKEEVVFVGLGDRVELWSIEEWGKLEESVQDKASFAIEQIAKDDSGGKVGS